MATRFTSVNEKLSDPEIGAHLAARLSRPGGDRVGSGAGARRWRRRGPHRTGSARATTTKMRHPPNLDPGAR
uniref:Uncharacterized protein n=1 Tax=Oryza brachyantha TaxID=4533 RepID=J3MM58_ORYBR